MNSVWILLACGVACAYAHPTCDQSAIENCGKLMPSLAKSEWYPNDPTKFRNQCSQAISGYDCLADVVNVCPNIVSQKEKEYYVAANNLLHKTCEAGQYQDMYFRSAKCLNNVMGSLQEPCRRQAERASQNYRDCTYYKTLERCLYNFVTNTCGEEALKIFDDSYSLSRELNERGACDKQ